MPLRQPRAPIAAETARLAAGGLALYFQHGNRDFLLGEHYAGAGRADAVARVASGRFAWHRHAALHGDRLCTDDVQYQAFRQQSRNPAWQAAILAMSIEERIAMARNARETSMQHKGAAALDIMDVNQAAVIQAFEDNAVSRIIHGHTHRPAVHHLDLGDAKRHPYRTGGLVQAGSYLEVNAETAISLTALAPRCQRLHFFLAEPCLITRLQIERPARQPSVVSLQQFQEGCHRLQPLHGATVPEPAGPDRNVPDFFGENDFKCGDGFVVPHSGQALYHAGRNVQSARLQHPRNQRHALQAASSRLLRHFPQAVVRRKITVSMSHVLQPESSSLKWRASSAATDTQSRWYCRGMSRKR